MNNRRHLKNYLLNPRFQLKYVTLAVTGGLLVTVIYGFVFYTFTRENYALLVDLAPMTEEVKVQLYSELRQIMFWLAVSSAVFMVTTAVLALVLSHRSAGPLYQFKRVFEEVRQGKLDSRIRLRPGDDFQDVAAAFNEMMDDVSAKRTDTRNGTDRKAA